MNNLLTLDNAHLVTVVKLVKMYGRAPRVLTHTNAGSTTSKIGPGSYSPRNPIIIQVCFLSFPLNFDIIY